MSEGPAEPHLDPATLGELQKGVAEFNSGKYYECHETLEDVWRGTRGPARDFFQGLIQISVGFYHLRNGNLPGGESQLHKGLKRLAGYGDPYLGLDLCTLRCEVQAWLDKLGKGEKLRGAHPDIPRYRFTPPEGPDRDPPTSPQNARGTEIC